MDIETAIKRMIKTGKVAYGERGAIKSLSSDKVKLVIISKNMPRESKDRMEQYAGVSKTPLFVYAGTSLELGETCGKPFLVSALAVLDQGDVNITEFTKGTKA